MAADGGFVIPLAVALTSLALAHEPDELLVTVLHDGFEEADRERVARSVAGRLDLCWRKVSPKDLEGAHYTAGLSPAALFRLLVPELLPQAERVIYLDADTVVTSSLRPLWELDLDGHHAAAVRDGGTAFAAGPLGPTGATSGSSPASRTSTPACS